MKIFTMIAVATLIASPAFAQTAAPGAARTMDSTSPDKAETTKPSPDMHRSTSGVGTTTTDNKQMQSGGQPAGSTLTGR